MRSDERALFDAWIEKWRDLARFEVIPVRTSAEAARHVESYDHPLARVLAREPDDRG